eukprot:14943816-Heterocapsa_arctica.AAC.1
MISSRGTAPCAEPRPHSQAPRQESSVPQGSGPVLSSSFCFASSPAPQGGDSERISKEYASLTRPELSHARSASALAFRACLISPLD